MTWMLSGRHVRSHQNAADRLQDAAMADALHDGCAEVVSDSPLGR
ncbi:hypothetical protein [Tateyamaria sp.]